MTRNPTALTILKQGGKIELPTGYYLRGSPSDSYIYTGHEFGSDGLWILNRDGLSNALRCAREYERDQAKAARGEE